MVLLEKEFDFQKTCRTCLGEFSDMSCIFDTLLSTDDKVPLSDFFRRLTSLKVNFPNKNENFPFNKFCR